MRPLTYRNARGELVDVAEVPATRFKNEFGALFDRATTSGPVAITRHNTPRAVLVSFEEFQSLLAARDASLAALDAQFDGMLRAMQGPGPRKAMEEAFEASPERLGRAAVAAAKGARTPKRAAARKR
jgi:prevent-host-death family protein